jgi:hypothetical protein
VAAGIAVLGTLIRSGLINIASATFMCNNESAVLSTNRPLTDSIFNYIEGDHDLVSTIKDLQENWCRGLDIMYDWVKGRADDLNRELNRAERLNVYSVAASLRPEECKVIRMSMGMRNLCNVHSGEQNHKPHEIKAHTTTTRRQSAILPREETTLECAAL